MASLAISVAGAVAGSLIPGVGAAAGAMIGQPLFATVAATDVADPKDVDAESTDDEADPCR